jgi:NodT family efflux transporter outer membrane factor (OMF) lipoprotein
MSLPSHPGARPGRRCARAVVAALAVAVLGGCTVGPNFERPAQPEVERYTAGSPPQETVSTPGHGGGPQLFVGGAELQADWWRLFRSDKLDEIIHAALSGSQTLKQAQARLREAQANLEAARGALLPQLSVGGNVQRQRTSGSAFGGSTGTGTTFNLFSTTANVSFNPDVFGGQRRTIEGQEAAVQFQQHETQAAYLTLLGNTTNAVIAEANARAEIKATQEILDSDQRELEIIEAQYERGAVAYPDVLSARSRVAAIRARLPPLEQQVNQNQHLLATLTGRLPAQWVPPTVEIDELTLPEHLPVGVPSRLVRRRPDILAAESQLHQASAQIGVATANLYPSFTLSASYGSEATTAGNLFTPGAEIWTLGMNLLAPIFQGGTLRARKRAAVAAYEAALGSYQQTVLGAFQQVADALRALEHDAQVLRAQFESLRSASAARDIVEAQFEVGRAAYLDVLTAQVQYQQARIAYVQAQAQRYQDTVALFVALGGGWWEGTPPGMPQPQPESRPQSQPEGGPPAAESPGGAS